MAIFSAEQANADEEQSQPNEPVYRNDPSFWTDRFRQTLKTQIRLLLFSLQLLDSLIDDRATLFKFQDNYCNFSDVRIFSNFMASLAEVPVTTK